MTFLLTTTGTQDPVTFNDLGARSFDHPTVDFDLLPEYELSELSRSADLAAALSAGEITLKDGNGNNISDLVNIFIFASAISQADGIASLDSGGKVPASQIPAAFLPEVHVVADATARLALTVQEGDEAIQTDDSSHWIWDGAAWFSRPNPITFPLAVEDEGSPLTAAAKKVNFAGAGVTVTEPVTDELLVTIPGSPAGTTPHIIFGIRDGNDPYLEIQGQSYGILSYLIFPGTNDGGSPTNIRVALQERDTAPDVAVKIFDLTNSLTVAEDVSINLDGTFTIYDLGALSNLSAGQSVWEIQGKENGTSNRGRISSIIVEY